MHVQSVAKLKYVSIPARKMRLVANMVKGMPVQKALDVLNFLPRIAARHLAKTLKSAAANALSQQGTDHLRPENLTISNIVVDEAPTAKRIRFQSMGRVFRYRKRFSHLTVFLHGETDAVEEAARRTTRTRKVETAEPVTEQAVTPKETGTKTVVGKKTTARKATKSAGATKRAKTSAKGKSATKKAQRSGAKSKSSEK